MMLHLLPKMYYYPSSRVKSGHILSLRVLRLSPIFLFYIKFHPKSLVTVTIKSFLSVNSCTVLRHGHCLKNSLSSCVVLFLLLSSSVLSEKNHVKPFDTIAIKSLALSFLSRRLTVNPKNQSVTDMDLWINLFCSWSHSRFHKTVAGGIHVMSSGGRSRVKLTPCLMMPFARLVMMYWRSKHLS